MPSDRGGVSLLTWVQLCKRHLITTPAGRVLNGNGSDCCPLSWSAAWEEGLNLLKLQREMKPGFPFFAGAICEQWVLVAKKKKKGESTLLRWSATNKRGLCFESQGGRKCHMFRAFKQLKSTKEMNWVTPLCVVSCCKVPYLIFGNTALSNTEK